MFQTKFDIVLSLGEDCGCTMYLRLAKLRKNSFPFDWLTNATFEQRIHLLETHFKGFLEKENMKKRWKPSTGLRDIHSDNYEDINSTFYFFLSRLSK